MLIRKAIRVQALKKVKRFRLVRKGLWLNIKKKLLFWGLGSQVKVCARYRYNCRTLCIIHI